MSYGKTNLGRNIRAKDRLEGGGGGGGIFY